jgi:UDP-2,3-diacylglucosamine pyrophosphatase LpxH
MLSKATLGANGIRAVVVSDLHIGLPFFRKRAFVRLVESLDEEIVIVLNGDIVDNPHQSLEPEDEAVLDFLRRESFRRRIIWIYGNHDEDFRMADPGQIEFLRHLQLGSRLMIVHGDDFDSVMPNNLWFIRLFKFCHQIRLRLGAAPVHVAELAKRWTPLLYRVLTEQVKRNAIACAMQGGFEAIACGHTHCAEDVVRNGVHYLNSGSWTEERLHYVSVDSNEIRLIAYQRSA